MKRVFYILCSILLTASVCNTMQAQSLMQTAKKAEQRAKELKQQETARYNAIIDSRDLSKYNQYITDYPRGGKTQEIRSRVAELNLWNSAKSSNTIAGYESYLKSTKYHWYDIDANNEIQSLKQKVEKQVWDKVVEINTIAAYKQYLQQNPNSGYRLDAEKAINRLKGYVEWQKIKGTKSICELQSFISSYPYASEVNIASVRLRELKGVQYYTEGKLELAFIELSKLNINEISPENRNAYNEVIEYNDFQKLGNYALEGDLLSFINKHPNSIYYNQVCNKLAINRARNLGAYSSDSDYVRALSYAKDNETKKIVESYIAKSKKLKSDKIRTYNANLRKQNGGTFNLGFDFLDFGFNSQFDTFYYNIGLMFRLGNFNDRVQFSLGAKPGFIRYEERSYCYDDYFDYYYYDSSENHTTFHLPFVCQLKFNLFKFSENSRFFIYGKYQYNVIRKTEVEGEMAWGAGIGLAWKNFDWSFYYRQDLSREDYTMNNTSKFWGMSLIYYWQL